MDKEITDSPIEPEAVAFIDNYQRSKAIEAKILLDKSIKAAAGRPVSVAEVIVDLSQRKPLV